MEKIDKITTYKHILNLILKIEKEEEDFRVNRFNWLLGCYIVSACILIGYLIYNWETGVTVSREMVGVALTPAFSYLLRSYEEDHINLQRVELLNLINKTFDSADLTDYKFTDSKIKIDIIKEIIHEQLKSKFNNG